MTTDHEAQRDPDEPVPAETVPLDILITRLADGDAPDQDWEEFQRRAAQDHTPWKLLAEEQYIATQLRVGFERVAIRTDLVELPVSESTQVAALTTQGTRDGRSEDHRPLTLLEQFAHFGRTYGGWAAAAMLALVWTISVTLPTNTNTKIAQQPAGTTAIPGQSIPNAVSVNDSMTPDQYYDKYLQAPFVVKELQPLLLQTGTDQKGQPVVTYMRRIIEKRSVNGIYRRASDGYNDSVLIPGSVSGLQNNDTIY